MKNVHVQRKIRILTSTIQSGGEILESFFFLQMPTMFIISKHQISNMTIKQKTNKTHKELILT